MEASRTVHPSDKTLSDFGLGKLDDPLADAVGKHVAECDACRGRVGEATSDSFLGRLREAKARPDSSGPFMSSLTGVSGLSAGPRGQAPPPADTLPPGLADHPDYQILRELGRGGMGVVYLAENKLMERKEVLKVVGSHLLNRKGVRERFLREIRAAAQLHHPNIVSAYSATRIGESIVFAMQYVEGYDLAKLVEKSGPLPVAHACNFIHQAALGLQHAHEHGMVHRDIKPSNLMLAREGNKPVVKVLDFGLAKVASEAGVDGGLTHEGQMLGTPHYVAPEQTVDAQKADIRADIYSLGCTLYCLLTGRPPFDAASLYELLQAHHSMDAKPLNFVRPEVPAELAAVVAKMLAKEPERRFQAPGEIAKALSPFFKRGGTAPSNEKVSVSLTEHANTQGEPIAPRAVPKVAGSSMTPAPRHTAENTSEVPPREAKWDTPVSLHGEPESKLVTSRTRTMGRRSIWVSIARVAGLVLFGAMIIYAASKVRIWLNNGVIELSGLPEDAQVSVDNDEVKVQIPGQGEPFRITIDPGDHRVDVKKDGFQVWSQYLTLAAGKTKRLEVRMIPQAGVQADGSTRATSPTSPATDGIKGGIGSVIDVSQNKDEPGTGRTMAETETVRDTRMRGEPLDGFVSLFNGRDLSGWKIHPSQRGGWDVKNGILSCSGGAVSHLYSQRNDYNDFHLRVEARINDGGNSGVFFRTGFGPVFPAGNPTWPSGYEAQINSTHRDVNKTGSLYVQGGLAIVSVRESPVVPSQWFTLEIIAKENHILILVNGARLADYRDLDHLFLSGGFALQHHNPQTVVEFRKIEIKELNVDKSVSGDKSVSHGLDELQEGSVWKGIGGYEYPPSYPKEYVMTFTVTRRESDTIEIYYRGANGRVECDLRGTITDRRLKLMVHRSRKGEIDFADSPITGTVTKDMIEGEVKHKTSRGEPAYCRFTLHKEKSVSDHSDGRRKYDPTPIVLHQSFDQSVLVSAKQEFGYVVGGLRKGDRLMLQYQYGKWKAWGTIPTECPDSQVIEGGELCRLAICGLLINGKSTVLAVVPAGTKDQPFEWVADQDYDKIILRINDNDNDFASNPDAGVQYRLRLLPSSDHSGSTSTGAFAWPETKAMNQLQGLTLDRDAAKEGRDATPKKPARQKGVNSTASPVTFLEEMAQSRGWCAGSAFSADSKLLATFTGGLNKQRCIDLETGKVLFEWYAPKPVIGDRGWGISVLFGPDGNIVTSHADQAVRVWDGSKGQLLREFDSVPLGENYTNLRYSKQGGWVAGASDTQIRIWDYKSGKQRKRYLPKAAAISLDVHPNGKLIASLHKDNIISVWDGLTEEALLNVPDPTKRVARLSFSPDGERLLCLTRGVPEFYLMDWHNGVVAREFAGPLTNIVDASFIPIGRRIAIASAHADDTFRVWDIETGAVIYAKAYDQAISSIGVSPDGGVVIIVFKEPNRIVAYRVGGGKTQRTN